MADSLDSDVYKRQEGERKIALLQKEVRDREKGEQADRRDKEADVYKRQIQDCTQPDVSRQAGHLADGF